MRAECLACGLCTGQVVKSSALALELSVIIVTSCETDGAGFKAVSDNFNKL
jgi:hypothetical protein